MTDQIHDTVRERYAAAAMQAGTRNRCLLRSRGRHRRGPVQRARARRAARRGRAGIARLRQPDRGRRAARGRTGARPRLGRRDRRASLGQAGRPDRPCIRPRHDRRDARARAPQRGRGGRDQRRVPQGPDRGDPAPGGFDRCRDQQLRRQPRRRQAGRLPRDRARAASGRPHRHQRHRRRGLPVARPARRARLVRRLHRRRPLLRRVRVRAARRRTGRHLTDADPPGDRWDAQRHREGNEAGIGRCPGSRRPSCHWRPPAAAAAPEAAARGFRPTARLPRPPRPPRPRPGSVRAARWPGPPRQRR